MKERQVKCDYTNLVVAIPHSYGTVYEWKWNNKGHDDAIRRWTDWFVDELFKIEALDITVVKSGVSRFDCDVEWIKDEEDRLVRSVHEEEASLRKFVSRNGVRRNSLRSHWFKYRADILAARNDGRPLIIDAHSFPSDIAPDVDVCIGFNEDLCKPYEFAIDGVKRIFSEAGYSVALNHPYANAIVPKGYTGHSMTIEVSKRLYINEETLEKSDGFGRLQGVIRQVYDELLWTPRHEPVYFHNPNRAAGETLEEMKREMVHYIAERFGLKEPQDLSRISFRIPISFPSWQQSADWLLIANAMLTTAFARVGETVPKDGLVQHYMARCLETEEWMKRLRKSRG